MDIILYPLLKVISTALSFFQTCVFIYVLLSMLETFGLVNKYSRFVYGIHMFLFRIVDPFLSLIRRFLPKFGNIDLSPMILIFGLYFIQEVIVRILIKFPA